MNNKLATHAGGIWWSNFKKLKKDQLWNILVQQKFKKAIIPKHKYMFRWNYDLIFFFLIFKTNKKILCVI